MHLVREMKKYGEARVANAMEACGFEWKNPKRRQKSIERMVDGLPHCELKRILNALQLRV
jgi:hypothetical protein